MKITSLLASIACLGLGILPAVSAQAGDNDYIGEIFMTGANFCPRSTASLDGQLLSISQNQALFSILGTTYGGDGRTTFGLPDMRGRSAVHAGRGPGLSSISLGAKSGTEKLSLMTGGQSKGKIENGRNLAGSEQTLNNRDPYLAIKYCIVMQGMYPSRN